MSTTIDFYSRNASAYASGTMNADLSGTRNHFLSHLPDGAKILDFGCGVGRDTKDFLSLGYAVDAVDGSAELCAIASEYTGNPGKTSSRSIPSFRAVRR